MRTKPLFSCLLLGLLPGALCMAQEEPPITIPPIVYTDILPDFHVGGAVDVHLDPQSLDGVGGVDGLQARIIRGSMRTLKNKRFKVRGGCLFYRSHVYSLGRSAIGAKLLKAKGGPDMTLTPDWLSREPKTVGGNQSFVMVIEKKGPTKTVLTIRPEDAATYFDTGLEFIVKSTRRLEPSEEQGLIQRGEKALAETAALAQAATTDVPGTRPTPNPNADCLNYSRVSTGMAFLMTEPCPVEIAGLTPPRSDLSLGTAP